MIQSHFKLKNNAIMKENKKDDIKHPDNREIGKKLIKGDRIEISRLSGKSLKYVRDVLLGYRHNDEIIAWAERLINDRNLRLKQIVNPTRKSNIS